jgi:glutathione S-transferase
MIKVHHLNNSRSQRILWLLEELQLDYEIIRYQRDQKTRLAPPELTTIHPLGKSPVIEDEYLKLHESGAITSHLIHAYGDGRMAPKENTDQHARYVEWLHYSEGSAMLPLLLHLYTSRLGEAANALEPRISGETDNHFTFMNNHLRGRDYFIGDDLTGADIMMSFPIEIAMARGFLDQYDALLAYLERIQLRPAYQSALKKGGDYSMAFFKPGE